MDIVLGINTAFALKRWPRVEDWAPFVQRDLGITHVQVCLDLVDLHTWASAHAEAERHRDVLAAEGLVAHSTFTGLNAYSENLLLHPDVAARDRSEAWYRRAIGFTAESGAQATGGHVGAYSVRDWRDAAAREKLRADLQRRLGRLSAYAKAAGLSQLFVENLASLRETATMEAVRDLLRAADARHAAIRACIDVGHQSVPGLSAADADPYAWLTLLGKDTGCIHLQQNDGMDRHWPFTEAFNTLGVIEAPRLLDAIANSGTDSASLFLEITAPPRDNDDEVAANLRESIHYWREAIGCWQRARTEVDVESGVPA